jgi:hypothetical protein
MYFAILHANLESIYTADNRTQVAEYVQTILLLLAAHKSIKNAKGATNANTSSAQTNASEA